MPAPFSSAPRGAGEDDEQVGDGRAGDEALLPVDDPICAVANDFRAQSRTDSTPRPAPSAQRTPPHRRWPSAPASGPSGRRCRTRRALGLRFRCWCRTSSAAPVTCSPAPSRARHPGRGSAPGRPTPAGSRNRTDPSFGLLPQIVGDAVLGHNLLLTGATAVRTKSRVWARTFWKSSSLSSVVIELFCGEWGQGLEKSYMKYGVRLTGP
jgi:hypothetical protein